jgi:ubiquinone/menaquinone biosynthesis C-methylase UbiE
VRGSAAWILPGQRLDHLACVLDVGSGLGGPARTLAQTYGCEVTGVDLTPSFCEAAAEMSRWVGLADKVTFMHGDATALDFDAGTFDAAITIHAAMNIAAKDRMYAGIHHALKAGRIFAVYDVLQGNGGEVLYPVPWANDSSISHLATAAAMRRLLVDAGFTIIEEIDSTEASSEWFSRLAASQPAPRRLVSYRAFLAGDYSQMARNQVRNLAERRIRTVTFICRS